MTSITTINTALKERPLGAFGKKHVAKVEEPGTHEGRCKSNLSDWVAFQIRSVYEKMSDKDLLTHCQVGRTQNPMKAYTA
jgi:hypothetical protein